MKAIQVLKTGGPEALTLVDIPVPKPKANEAVVKISAAGVNFIDIYFREGRYPTQAPFVPGQEASGVVTDVGGEVKSFTLTVQLSPPWHLAQPPWRKRFRPCARSLSVAV